MKKLLAILLVAVMLVSITACGGNTPATPSGNNSSNSPEPSGNDSEKKPSKVYKLGHVSAADYPVVEALKEFADKVYELSDGDIKVEVYSDGQLGQEKDALEAVKLGSMGMTSVNGGAMPAFVPEYAAFTLPFVFRDEVHMWNVLDGELGQQVADKMAEAGFHLISYMYEGARHVYTSKKPVASVADMKGLKIRTTGSQASQDGFIALGAAPTPVNFGEVFTALQQGVVDGAENNYSSYYTSKHYEGAKYITDTAHLRVPGAFVMSQKEWESLTEAQQNAITEAAEYAKEWGINRFNEKENEYLEMCLEAGAEFVEFPAAEREKAVELMKPVFEKYKETVGADLMDGILNTK